MALEKSPRTTFSTRALVALILGATAVMLVSFVLGRSSAPVTVTPTSTSAEAGFARDMQTHHQQAVEMSLMIRDLTDNEEVRLLAYDITVTQSEQAGQMHGWLNVWGVPQAAPEPSMTWMTRPALDDSLHDHGGTSGPEDEPSHEPGDRMPGLATAEQLAALATLQGTDAESYFLNLMIAHHKGGVEMAQAVVERSTNRTVLSLARGMITVQQSEIDYMTDLLAER